MKYLNKLIITVGVTISILFSANMQNPVVGQNYMFWVLGQGFFSGYYQSSATLNAEGENAFVYTEDAVVRDVAVAPFDNNTLVATTNSGVFISTDMGETWVASHGTTGSNALPEQPANNLQNIDAVAYQHKEEVNSIVYLDAEEWWVGIKGTDDTKTVYSTTNAGDTWKKKSTGMPTFDGHNPTVNKLYFSPDSDDPWATTIGGLFFKDGSRFKNKGLAFPNPTTTDWPSIPAYDISVIDDTMLVVATEYGLFKGSIEEDFEDALPIGGGLAEISSIFTNYVVETVLDSTQTNQFTIDPVTGEYVWIYDYFTVLDTVSQNKTVQLIDESLVGRFANIVDLVSGNQWKGQINANSTFDLLPENIYFEGDSDEISEELEIHLVTGNPIYDLAVMMDGNIIYSTGNELVAFNTGEMWQFESTINDVAVSDYDIYIATSTGLLKLDNVWIEVTPKITMLNTNEEISYVTTSIAMINSDTIFVGCGNNQFDDPRTVTYRTGGVLASYDGGATWQSKNIGLTHRSSSPEDVQQILSAIDTTTIANPEMGIYESLTTFYGDTPNVDGNSKINVLIADMDDNAYNSTSDLVIGGYFNPSDQLGIEDAENSNQLDMVYIDSDPQDPGEAQEGLANSISRLICNNYDANEEEWILTGLDELGAYLTGHKTMPDAFILANDNSLMFGDYARSYEFDQLFLFMDYIYEQYSLDQIRTIVQSDGTGIDGLVDVFGDEFENLFSDFALAVHFDNPSEDLYGGKYGFTNVDVSVSTSTYPWGIGSGFSPYSENIKNWSVKYLQTEKWVDNNGTWQDKAVDFNQETLVFNGTNQSNYELFLIKQLNKDTHDATSTVEIISLDEIQNRAIYTDWSNFGSDIDVVTDSLDINQYQYFALVAVCRESGDDAGGSFVIDDEVDAPSMFNLQINQNSDLVNYLDIFAFSDVAIYGDGAVSSNSDLEGPKLEISNGTEIIQTFVVPRFFDAGTGYVYHESFDLESFLPTTISEYWFIGSAESIGGNEAPSDSLFVVAVKTDAMARTFESEITNLNMNIPSSALNEDEILTIIQLENDIANDEMVALDMPLMVGNQYTEFYKSIEVGFDISNLDLSNVNIDKLDIVCYYNNELVSLSATIDLSSMTVKSNLNHSGAIQLVENPLKSESMDVPMNYALHQNYPNPFNPVTTISYNLPTDADFVTLQVYNVVGQLIETLVNKSQAAGYHKITWDARQMPSGIYFYHLNANEFSQTQKMILVK
jgi:hypothetical protein